MPVLSIFFGIIITMNFDDHNPPHFHARYGEYKATFTLNGDLLQGDLPKKQLRLVQAWALIHEDDLQSNWQIAHIGGELFRIDPLH